MMPLADGTLGLAAESRLRLALVSSFSVISGHWLLLQFRDIPAAVAGTSAYKCGFVSGSQRV
jgi:hypothetical protein